MEYSCISQCQLKPLETFLVTKMLFSFNLCAGLSKYGNQNKKKNIN